MYDEEKREEQDQFARRGDYSPHNPDLAVENVKTPLNAFDNTPEFRQIPLDLFAKEPLVKHAQRVAAELNETLRLLQVRHNIRFKVDNEYSVATRLIDGEGIWSLKIRLSELIGG